jgi:hypothetical protein
MDPNIFKPGYRIEIKNEAQARIYRRVFDRQNRSCSSSSSAACLALSGWDWKMFLGVAAIATVWQFGPAALA